MAIVRVRLRTLTPRWALATSPWVRVNGGQPTRLTKRPVEFTVAGGPVVVEVALSRVGVDTGDTWFNPMTRFVGVADEGAPLALRFRPAVVSSASRRGRLRQE